MRVARPPLPCSGLAGSGPSPCRRVTMPGLATTAIVVVIVALMVTKPY